MIGLYKEENEGTLEVFIELLNKIIEEAVSHGGDPGGPYYCYPEELKKAIKDFLIWLSIEDKVVIYDSENIPKLLLKSKISNT
jgi:hypothetical protein